MQFSFYRSRWAGFAAGAAVLLAFFVLFPFSYGDAAGPSCAAVPFSQKFSQGGSAAFSLVLSPSQAGSDFQIAPGNMPTGVTATVTPASGKAPATLTFTMSADDNAQTGSMSIVFTYTEKTATTQSVTTCLANPIIEPRNVSLSVPLGKNAVSSSAGGTIALPAQAVSTAATATEAGAPSATSSATVETNRQVVTTFLPGSAVDAAAKTFSTHFDADLSYGAKNDDVARLQTVLAEDPTLYPEGIVTGFYGDLTAAAVRRLQKQTGLPETGVLDAATRQNLEDIMQEKTIRVAFTATLHRGMSGDIIKALQDILKSQKFFPDAQESTGIFGPITEQAVKDFQKAHHLEAVGQVGPLTRAVLNGLL